MNGAKLVTLDTVHTHTGICIQKGLGRTDLSNLKEKISYIINASNRHY